jgi:hypothetical protein
VPTRGWSEPNARFVDRQRALVERLGLGITALGAVQRGEVPEGDEAEPLYKRAPKMALFPTRPTSARRSTM